MRGALLDLLPHPLEKKMLVVVRVHGNDLTPVQCRAVLSRYCAEGDVVVVELEGSGLSEIASFDTDVARVQAAINELKLDD